MHVPIDSGYDTRKAIQELNDEVSKLNRKLDGLGGGVSQQSLEDLRKEVLRLTRRPQTLDFNDVFRTAGGPHALGFVPDPGPYAPIRGQSTFSDPTTSRDLSDTTGLPGEAADLRVLHENATWRHVLAGMIRAVPRGAGGTSNAQLILSALSSIALSGGFSADSVLCRTLDVMGQTNLSKVFQKTVSTQGNVTTGETTLAGYNFVIPANTLRVTGDCFIVFINWTFAANTAVKTIRFYLDSNSGTLFTTNANVANNIGWEFFVLMRTGTTGAGSGLVTGFIIKDVADQGVVNAFLTHFTLTTGGWDTDQLFKITAQATNTDDIRALRMVVLKL